ncbi:hypothetical protein C8J57DRAFT_1005365, partial [Mycena rebaudengoi]
MTDYGSQGKSRPYNVVDLGNCKNHLSYYVALSRGTSADGTAILQGFNEDKITSGMSGFLRQELRELEILDEITQLRFQGELPRHVTGLFRRHLLRSYQIFKGEHYDVSGLHPAIGWSAHMGPRILDEIEYTSWELTSKALSSKVEQKEQSAPHKKTSLKRKQSASTAMPTMTKKIKLIDPPTAVRHCNPSVVGTAWDSVNFSCAYDSLFGILYNIW